ncbi:hypothetical protein SEA_EMOTION_69 [Arthrobacter phage Emotion]|uniref:Uncharacterized protein n=1 Tax=Arthrobacter phage Emotion TaxID=3038361 RepID=A0AA49ILT5_9CAUD|nr:hypothetical protein SEA_EMOTION_69 [Arthrobacter phage Emotion]
MSFTINAAEVKQDAEGVLESWLPGYDDRTPQYRIVLLESDEGVVVRYEGRDGQADKTYRIRVSVEEVAS